MNSSRVLEIFKEITTIPRESGHEELITKWLMDWASSHSLEARKDATGNVCITREAAPGKEDVPTIVLQAHQDMVCEKLAGCTHDFSKDPVPFVIEDGWMVSKETTLGADDGIGIAAALALLESSEPTGKIEAVFTISEETGMDGAFAMEKGFFTGKTLINLDSEDEGQLFIGCAGGLNTQIMFRYDEVPVNAGWKTLRLSLLGGLGGHSGDDIDKGRCNTVQTLAAFMYGELEIGLQLVSFVGGGKHNAIAREAVAVVAVPDPAATQARLKTFESEIRAQYHTTDPSLTVSAEPMDSASAAISNGETIIRSMFTAPHGMFAMSQDIPGLVQTSTNLASIKMLDGGRLTIGTSQRSSSTFERRIMAARVRAAFELAGAEVTHAYEYPGWNPDINSHILKVCVDSYRKLFGTEPEVKAIHAGLECGLFLEKFGGLDMISFGPTLRGVHTPGERLDLASLDKFVELLDDVVCNYR